MPFVRVLSIVALLSGIALAQGRDGRRGPPRAQANELLLPFDVSRDGSISKSERAAAFRHFDADRSGRIEQAEVVGPAGAAFAELDRDGDGGLSPAEFRRAAARMPRMPQPRAALPRPDDPLPALTAPKANPWTAPKAVLGKMLFWEQQVSSSGTVACGTCHSPRHGGADARIARHPGPDGVLETDDDVFGSPGVASRDRRNRPLDTDSPGTPQVTPRSSPAFFRTLHAPRLFSPHAGGGSRTDSIRSSRAAFRFAASAARSSTSSRTP